MKRAAWALLAAAALAIPVDPEPAIEYFAHVREVAIDFPERQNYVVLDAEVWTASLAGLADLRLYEGTDALPYSLQEERGGVAGTESAVRVLNAARRGDHTEFDLEIAGAAPYNRIRLELDRKDFVATAHVEGFDSLRGAAAAVWPTPSTLFDFTSERLGANSTIALPTWTYRYVHVRLSPGLTPAQVKGAAVSQRAEKQAGWTDAGACRVRELRRRETVIDCVVPEKVPVDRIRFDVAASRVNFLRFVTVSDARGRALATGSLSRIRIARGGTTVVSEELAVRTPGTHSDTLTLTVQNGDDPPLAFTAIQPQMVERRLYFDPRGRRALKLYSGDAKLSAPVYDFDKFFDRDPRAPQARLGPDAANPAYTGRGDDRPWSERHKAVMWIAMLVAVAGLAALAIGGLRAAPPPVR